MSDHGDPTWVRLRQLFRAAGRLEPAGRPAYLDEACGDDRRLRERLQQLLDAGESAPRFLDDPIVGPAAVMLPPAPERLVGLEFDGYRLERILARGGMGTVFEATQRNPNRTVALKVLNAGMVTEAALRRFEHESQILARLQHPGIAQIYEAGVHTAEGGARVPYFALEYVRDATAVTVFARRRGLAHTQRLELLAGVCDAVHHGHQKGVVHRDLKPDNILVGPDGRPKVIDFGIARVTDPEAGLTTMTQRGQLMGTLQYMSPEQLSGNPHDVDTRSDVFALGVVLFELLCERHPFAVTGEATYEAVLNARLDGPALPSSIDRSLRGDLQTIVLKALERDREHRYRSAADLADDIRRYLRHEPILARPHSAAYHMRLFATRNRGITGAAAGALLFLVLGVLGVGWQAAEATREARAADEVSEFLIGMFDDPDRNRAGSTTVREILDRGTDRIQRDLGEQPGLRARLLATMGFAYRRLGLLDEARAVLEEALTANEEAFGEDDPRVGTILYELASVLNQRLERDRGRALLERSRSILERALGSDHPEVVHPISRLATMHFRDGEFEAAQAMYERSLDILRRAGDESTDHGGKVVLHLGKSEAALGRYDRAREHFEQALPVLERVNGEEHRSVASALDDLADLLQLLGDLDRAHSLHTRALAVRTNGLPPEHPQIGSSHFGLGNNALLRGDGVSAREHLQRATDLWLAVYGPGHPRVTEGMGALSRALILEGDHAGARSLLERCLAVIEAEHDTGHVLYAQHLGNLARVFEAEGDLAGAASHFERALSIRESGPPTLELAGALYDAARLREATGRAEGARSLHRRALEIRQRWLPPEHRDRIASVGAYSRSLRLAGRHGEAERVEASIGATAARR